MPRNKDQTQISLKVPNSLSASDRSAVAEEVIKFITDRTRLGNNVFHRDWSGDAGKYNAAYAKKKGTSPNGPVDLSLSFDMLDSMKYFSSKSGTGQITIGFKKGTKNERKAEGNIIGSYGGDPNPKKARPFLDILKKDLDQIVRDYTNGG